MMITKSAIERPRFHGDGDFPAEAPCSGAGPSPGRQTAPGTESATAAGDFTNYPVLCCTYEWRGPEIVEDWGIEGKQYRR